jgi:hypothetical protein
LGPRFERGKNYEKEARGISSPSIIKMIKSRRIKLAGHVARIGKKSNAYVIDGKSSRKETTM